MMSLTKNPHPNQKNGVAKWNKTVANAEDQSTKISYIGSGSECVKYVLWSEKCGNISCQRSLILF